MDRVWGLEADGKTHAGCAYPHLRQKLGEAGNMIENSPRLGYKLGDRHDGKIIRSSFSLAAACSAGALAFFSGITISYYEKQSFASLFQEALQIRQTLEYYSPDQIRSSDRVTLIASDGTGSMIVWLKLQTWIPPEPGEVAGLAKRTE